MGSNQTCFQTTNFLATDLYFSLAVYKSDTFSIISLAGRVYYMPTCLLLALALALFLLISVNIRHSARASIRGLTQSMPYLTRSMSVTLLTTISVSSATIGHGLAMPASYDDGLDSLLIVIACNLLAACVQSSGHGGVHLRSWFDMSRRAAAKRRADEMILRDKIPI